ncbi:MAG: NADH-quinone oxidoreductase subunit NuoE [Rhodobacteraceae bacterium]|nr:NADH-quinone oxidoreductase subunit NuoE [Paracoccaceae bacterium]
MLRRLHHTQPDSFAFTAANLKWAEAQIAKYPEGRQASAVIPLLWRAQEQEGWLTRPAIEAVGDMLGMAHIRVLEVATFYFMYQLQPVGSVAHIQVCGTTTCMICGAEDLISICRELIAPNAHELSADGKFSWEEVECLGACTNAPMVQIGKDFYEDLTADKFRAIMATLANGEVPLPGPQNGRYAAEPLSGLTSLTDFESGRARYNASVDRAVAFGDTIKRIQGDEVPILKSRTKAVPKPAEAKAKPATRAKPASDAPATTKEAVAKSAFGQADSGKPKDIKPAMLKSARDTGADDLKRIKGVGPKLETLLNSLGVWHFDQIAGWSSEEIAWVDENLTGFRGRVSRDDWQAQAKILASGGETEFSRKVKKGGVY